MDQVRMTLRAHTRWRVGLTIAIAIVAAIGAASCFGGVFAYYGDGAFRERGFSLAQATISANYSDRSSMASQRSRMPAKGWRWETNTTIGRPLLNWGAQYGSQSAPFPSWAMRVPLWMLVVLLGVPCGWMWWKHLRRPRGQCECCGYDLRGTPGDKCPECGIAKGPPERRARVGASRPNLWRLRRMFFRPVALGILLALLLAAGSSYFYVYVKVWMFGTEDVMLAGLSGRTLCVQRIDYNPAISERAWHNAQLGIVAPPLQCWPTNRWVDAAWLGPDLHWESSWFPTLHRRTNGWIVAIPWWNMAVAGGVFLVGLHILQSRGFCRHCGYDLKDLPGDICPECGHAFRDTAQVSANRASSGAKP